MTVFEKTWVTDANRVPVQTTQAIQAAYVVWWWKALLKNAGLALPANAGAWTVYQSSDGVACGTAGDGVDRWTDVFTSSLLVAANAGTAHSWIVLKSPSTLPSGPVYLVIDRNNVSNNIASFSMSRTAPSGGTIQTAPSAADAAVFSAQTFLAGGLASLHMHANLATDGSFMIFLSYDGTGHFTFALSFIALEARKTGDLWPYAWGAEYNASGIWGLSNMISSSIPIPFKGRNGNNTVAVQSSLLVPSTDVDFWQNIQPSVDPTDSKANDFPVALFTATVGNISLRGRVPDVYNAPGGLTNGTVEPSTGGPPYQSTVVGNFWVPWVGISTPPVL